MTGSDRQYWHWRCWQQLWLISCSDWLRHEAHACMFLKIWTSRSGKGELQQHKLKNLEQGKIMGGTLCKLQAVLGHPGEIRCKDG